MLRFYLWSHLTVINNKLNELQGELEKEFVRLSVTEKIEGKNRHLKNFCDKFFNKGSEDEQEHNELLPFYDWYINTYAVNPLPATGKPLTSSTIKAYRNSYNLIKRFISEEYDLTYEKVNKKFYYDFLDWLYSQDYSTSYVGTHIKILKTMMEAASEHGYHNNREYTKKFFKKQLQKSTIFFLIKQIKKDSREILRSTQDTF